MSKIQYSKIEQAIGCEDLRHNIRGQLHVASSHINTEQKAKLAFEYVKHVMWILDELLDDNSSFVSALYSADKFVKNEIGIADVLAARSAMLSEHYRVKIGKKTVGEIVKATLGVVSICCQAAIDATGLYLREKSEVTLYEVATSASYAIALHKAGANWDSHETELRSVARSVGRSASDKETLWQLDQLLELVASS